MSDKLQIAIYKIEAGVSLNELAVLIEADQYKTQNLISNRLSGFKLKLFYKRKPSFPKWKDFLSVITNNDQDILKSRQGWTENFVLLLHKENNGIYAVTGGVGYFVIQDHINKSFGIDIISRLLKKEDKALKATKDKSLVGGILGTTRYFRNNYNFYDNDSFGKIFQELKAILDKTILTSKLGFTENDVKTDSVCIAKASFSVNKAISFPQLLKIIDACELILQTAPLFPINSVDKLSKKKNSALIEELKIKLLDQLWDRYSASEDAYSFDICHNDFDKYLTASDYIVKSGASAANFFDSVVFKDLNDVDMLFEELRKPRTNPQDKTHFIDLINKLKIYSYDEEDNQLTKGDLLSHLLGDVPHSDGRRYFYVDNCWYQIKDTFIADLNAYCKQFVQSKYHDGLEKVWNPSMQEDDYISQYIGESQTLVLHKIKAENYELCDILKWDGDSNLYLYHIKSGFENTIRDLCAQIDIAASRLMHDISSDKTYIRKVYHLLKDQIGGRGYFDKIGKQTNNYSEDNFVNLFYRDRAKITFVLAILDTKIEERDIKEMGTPGKFRSNIAKFSIRELSKSMKIIDSELLVTQILRPS